jgi:hypothetical protein
MTVAQHLLCFHSLGCVFFGVRPQSFDGEGKELGGREGAVEDMLAEGVVAVHCFESRGKEVCVGRGMIMVAMAGIIIGESVRGGKDECAADGKIKACVRAE